MSDDEVSITIDFDKPDAAFLSAVQDLIEPVYLGDYSPDYLNGTSMASLDWSETSPLAEYEVDFGFTLDGTKISALYLDLREAADEVLEAIHSSISKLDQLRELMLFLDEDAKMLDLSDLANLQYLEISKRRNPITLPDLSAMTELVALVVRAHLEEIPDLSHHPHLQRLIMRSTQVKEFPTTILSLEKLVWLEFGNQFSVLPDGILNLEHLAILDLVSDNLHYIPDDIAKLSKLQHLSLETDKLTSLPTTFNQLSRLTDLYLWNLPFEELPASICELTSLKYLWFKDNMSLRGSLKRIPEEIGNLSNLLNLQLNGHEIAAIPSGLGKLSNLRVLNLGINQLTSFPSAILELANLKKLELYLNPIDQLPPRIGDLQSLQYLDISDTKIRSLPSSIANLRNLEDFDALGCDLDGLPEALTKLNYTKFTSFLISLHDSPDTLDQSIQDWLENLVKYANDNIEEGIQVEISLYQPEEDDKFGDIDDDNPALLEDDD